jgi:hypothetical protein
VVVPDVHVEVVLRGAALLAQVALERALVLVHHRTVAVQVSTLEQKYDTKGQRPGFIEGEM